MSQESDQSKIKLILDGDTQAFAALVSKYQHMVYNLAIKLVRDKQEAEEVAQDSFLQAYKSLSSFKGESKFSTWLYRIVYHKGLDALKKRKRKRKLEVQTIDAYTDFDFPSMENHWDSLEAKERKKIIKKAVEDLNGDDALLITLFYFEELSLNEIAEVLSARVGTVKVKLFRARKRLAKFLRQKLEPETIEGYEKT